MILNVTAGIATETYSKTSPHGFRALLLGAGCLALAACSGGDGASDYTVTATAGANGTISPTTDLVASGATSVLTLKPDSGYTISSVSGCGGSLSGNTYTTGAITADCTVTASFRAREFVWMSGSNTAGAYGVYGTQGTAAASNIPGGRDSGVSWTDASGNLWMFGGVGYTVSGAGFLNDLWKYDPGSGLWTWMSGSNTAGASGDYGVKGVAAASNVPGAREYASAWTDASGNLWLFGGWPGVSSGTLNDLWKYNPDNGQWTWVSGSSTTDASGNYGSLGVAAASNVPGARRSASAWTDTSGNLWLFGGMDASNNHYNDLWKYNITSGQWTWISGSNTAGASGNYGSLGVEAASNVPGARRSATSWTDANGNLWLFGGMDQNSGPSFFNDLWKYNITSGQWTWMSGANSANSTSVYGTLGTAAVSNVPGARASATAWTDASGKLWMFGGYGYDSTSAGVLNGLWKYDPANEQWAWEGGSNTAGASGVYGSQGTPAASNVPGARYDLVTWIDANGNPWLFGGYDDSDEFNDLWLFN